MLDLKLFIMPVLSLIVGIASLFTDINSPRRKPIILVLILALVATSGFGMYMNADGAKDITWQKARITNLTESLANFRGEANTKLDQIVTSFKNWGLPTQKVDVNLLSRAIGANQKRAELLSTLPKGYRSNTVIKFYPKDIDKNKVKEALNEIGFQVERGKATLEDQPTNALWFGVDVSLADVKFVGLTLLRAGIELQTIKPFNDPGKKQNIIEIASDAQYRSKPVLTPEYISSSSGFSR